jgi:hypothetical protein
LLWIFLVISQIGEGVYVSHEREPPGSYLLIQSLGFLWIFGWWLQKDSHKRGVSLTFDLGFFLSIAWPIILPCYLLKTRSAKALLTILAFVGVYLVAAIIGVAVYAVFSVA